MYESADYVQIANPGLSPSQLTLPRTAVLERGGSSFSNGRPTILADPMQEGYRRLVASRRYPPPN